MRKYILCFILILSLLLPGCKKEQACQAHVDKNADFLCDRCQLSVLQYIDFYGINDLHGKLDDAATHPGVDELTTYLRTMQANDDVAILLSAGDMWQGSAESNLTKGLIITDWMNELGFAAMCLGNHEFDWGESYIEANAQAAKFPMLAINVYDRETNQQVSYCRSSIVIDCGALQIGIIGAIGDCYSSIAPDKVQDIYFKTGRELTALVKAESERLRREEGVDFVVYTLHDGYGNSGGSMITEGMLSSYYDITLSDGYVDLVFEGHTHQSYLLRDSYGVYHVQSGGDNKGISHVEIGYHSISGEFYVTASELIQTDVYDSLPDDPIIKDLLDKYEEEISDANQILGINNAYRGRDELRQLIADLYLKAGQEKWGKEYDIVLGGGFISIRSPGNLPTGEVEYGLLQSLFPFDNELVLCSIRGRDLLDRFINTTNDNYFVCRCDSRKIDPSATYYIIVDSYSSGYAPNRLTEIARYGADVFARDLLAAYIAQGGLE